MKEGSNNIRKDEMVLLFTTPCPPIARDSVERCGEMGTRLSPLLIGSNTHQIHMAIIQSPLLRRLCGTQGL